MRAPIAAAASSWWLPIMEIDGKDGKDGQIFLISPDFMSKLRAAGARARGGPTLCSS